MHHQSVFLVKSFLREVKSNLGLGFSYINSMKYTFLGNISLINSFGLDLLDLIYVKQCLYSVSFGTFIKYDAQEFKYLIISVKVIYLVIILVVYIITAVQDPKWHIHSKKIRKKK